MYSGPYQSTEHQSKVQGSLLTGSMNGTLLCMTVFTWIQMDNDVP